MNVKNILISTALLASSLTAAAQETRTEIDYVPNWYVGVQAGGQYTLGEVSFGDLLSPNIQVIGGYNFNPVLGLRVGINAWQSKAGLTSKFNPDQNWKWKYIAPNVDATVNLSNLIAGYNPKRLVNVGVFAGIGANIAWGNDEAEAINSAYGDNGQNLAYYWAGTKVRFQGRAGANVDFRITDNWAVGAELNANVVGDHYNSKKSDNADWYFNLLVGAKYTFGKSYTTRTVKVQQPEPKVVEKIVEKIVTKEVPATNNLVDKKAEEKAPLRVDVFFTISSTKITIYENLKVKEVANYLKKNPQAIVEVTGYADKGTGKAEGNLKLSERRMNIVVDGLKKLGIDEKRIKASYKGDKEQPFEENDLNRVTICIAK